MKKIETSIETLFRKGVQFQFIRHWRIIRGIIQFDPHTKFVLCCIGYFDRLSNISRIVRWNACATRRE